MEFRLLGPLVVVEGARELRLGPPKQRALLALLLLRANELVPTERIVEELWADRPPPTAVKTVQVYVSQLRKILGASFVETRAPGYIVRLAPEKLDVHRFEAHVEVGRRLVAEGSSVEAQRVLDRALGLWRGDALAEFRYEPFAQGEIARLEELRLAAVELSLETAIALGRHAETISQLEALVRRQPLREPLRRLLMLALYRSGRQADALAAYQDARRTLVDELGLEPSAALQQLEQAILLQDPALDAPAGPEPAARTPASVAREREPARTAPGSGGRARKTVTALFCDVVSSTVLAERLDPEALRELLERFYRESSSVLARHGGTVEKFAGDAVMAVFGVPVAREDDALRAARAAIELRAVVGSRLPELEVRIGVETGEVIAGDVAAGSSFVTGSTVNVAKRLEEAAGPGEILLGAEAYALVAHAVEGELLEPLELKGRRGAHAAFRLHAVDAEAPAFLRRDDAVLVGRGAELGRLRALFEDIVAGRGATLVTIRGDAGIGKSRLVRELISDVGAAATILLGRCPPYGEGVTFLPLRELLVRAGRDEAELGATTHEIFAAARAIVADLAREAPVVAVFEDVHWAEPTFLDLVEYLHERLGAAPVLIVCLARPELAERRPGLVQEPAESIALAPLSATESELLLAGLGVPEPVRAGIAEAAEGNPLFAEQLAAIAGDRTTLPASIRAVLAERLDRLPSGERAVLERAAVAGRSFVVEPVVELCPPELRDDVQSSLQSLTRARLLKPDPLLPDGFRFQHVLIRDAAYEGIPKASRAALHVRMAELVEDDALVGYHLEQAFRYHEQLAAIDGAAYALAARSAQALSRAGRDALRRGDVPAAVSLLERASALVPEDDPSHALHLTELGYARIKAAELAGADAALAEAVEAARRHGDRLAELRATIEREFLRPYLGSANAAGEAAVADALMREFTQLGDELGLAKAWWLKSQADMVACRWQARADALEHALAHAQRAPDVRDELRQITANLARALYRGPTPVPAAIARCEQLCESAAGDRALLADLMVTLAALHAMRGDAGLARALYADAVAVQEELGLRFDRLTRAALGATIEALAGDLAAAERELRMARDALEAAGEHGVRSTFSAVLANLMCAQGRDDDAEALAREAAEAVDPADLGPQVLWRSALATVLARRGELGEAEELAREAVAAARTTDFAEIQTAALLAGAEVEERAGRSDEALRLVREAREVCRAKGNVVAAAALASRLHVAPFPSGPVAH